MWIQEAMENGKILALSPMADMTHLRSCFAELRRASL